MSAALACVPTLASVAYFVGAPSGTSLPRRVGASLHGIVIGLLAARVWHEGGQPYGAEPQWPIFLIVLLAPPALVGLALLMYRGKRSTHGWQAVNAAWYFCLVPVGAYVFLGGRM